jgi:hypothetical protein
MEASRRIRLERRTAFERPIVLESNSCELTVEPITRRGSRPHVPFLFKKLQNGGSAPVRGELVLRETDPLHVLIADSASDEDAHAAWVHMLLGFAELTCNGPEPANPGAQNESQPSRWGHADHGRHHGNRETIRTRRPWSESLEPTGRWYASGGTYVAAHISRLPFGKEHSPEAAELARQLGIILRQHETWVRTHVRGIPRDAEIRFRWHIPASLSVSYSLR